MARTIYGIFWEQYVYVGQTNGPVESRWRQHLVRLNQRIHQCKPLQQLYMLASEEFRFEVLQTQAYPEDEAKWIKYFGDKCLNKVENPNRSSGTKFQAKTRGNVEGRNFVIYADNNRDVVYYGNSFKEAVEQTGLSHSAVRYRKIFDRS